MKGTMLLGLIATVLCVGSLSATEQPTKDTETVLVTHRVQEGKEKEYAKLLELEWSTLRRLGMVLERPHVVLRGTDESGRTIFVEVLTWRDHDAPDNAPPEVEQIWKELEARVEKRLGHRGIEFPEFTIAVMDDCSPGQRLD
jgi:hypothetical protein